MKKEIKCSKCGKDLSDDTIFVMPTKICYSCFRKEYQKKKDIKDFKESIKQVKNGKTKPFK